MNIGLNYLIDGKNIEMKIIDTKFRGLKIIRTPVYEDQRGRLSQVYNIHDYGELLGVGQFFVHELISVSHKNVFRGLHFQEMPFAQGKLVQVLFGSAIDYALDLRKTSETYGQYFSFRLDASIFNDEHTQLWIPKGFAHGFLSLEYNTIFHYKCTDVRMPDAERVINANSIITDLFFGDLTLSPRDEQGMTLEEYDKIRTW